MRQQFAVQVADHIKICLHVMVSHFGVFISIKPLLVVYVLHNLMYNITMVNLRVSRGLTSVIVITMIFRL